MGSSETTGRVFGIGLVIALIAYFLPWYAHPTAGLTLIGIDISEWLKFLPQARSGELPHRDLFYLPPIALGLSLMLWSGWLGNSWLKRGVGLAIGAGMTLIAFPSLDAIRFEPSSEWQQRIVWIGIAIVIGLLPIVYGLLPSPNKRLSGWVDLLWAGLISLSVAAALYLSLSAAFAFRPVYIEWLQITPAYGSGIWLYCVGSLLVIGSQLPILLRNLRSE